MPRPAQSIKNIGSVTFDDLRVLYEKHQRDMLRNREYNREYMRANREKYRDYNYASYRGLTVEEYRLKIANGEIPPAQTRDPNKPKKDPNEPKRPRGRPRKNPVENLNVI